MPFQTKFTAATSVDTWDAHFRWRTDDRLRDRTIDATWQRVASTVASVEKAPLEWEARFVAAFCEWRMLPDAWLLQWAGTGLAGLTLDKPRATLNLGAFIVHPQASQAYFDWQAFSATAALAVRFLDDVWSTYGSGSAPFATCVGVMGFADALASLGYTYVSERACEFASEVGRTLSDACLESSLLLAEERGSGMQRHSRTTAIHSQPLVALLANQACDALDPLFGSAWDPASRWIIPMRADPWDTRHSLLQQIRIRSCMQPWIDAPIDYPLIYSGDALDLETISECRRFARQHRLPEPMFRRSEQDFPSSS